MNKNFPGPLFNLKKYFLLFVLAVFTFCSGCGEQAKQKLSTFQQEQNIDTSAAQIDSTEIVKPIPPTIIHYNYYHFTGLKSLTDLREKYGSDGKYLILALNRLDSRNIKARDSIVIPDTIFSSIMRYSPFPNILNSAASIHKLLIFSYPIQAFAAYENGKLILWGPTSMGKRSTPTPTGLFATNWKAKVTTSTVNNEWILPWAFNIANYDGVSIHQFDLPGYPASHACARLLKEDAQWIYYWADQWLLTKDGGRILAYGTPVIIYGKYDFKSIPPWKKLVENPDILKISEVELDSIINEYKPRIMRRQVVRDSILTKNILAADSIKSFK